MVRLNLTARLVFLGLDSGERVGEAEAEPRVPATRAQIRGRASHRVGEEQARDREAQHVRRVGLRDERRHSCHVGGSRGCPEERIEAWATGEHAIDTGQVGLAAHFGRWEEDRHIAATAERLERGRFRGGRSGDRQDLPERRDARIYCPQAC